MRLLTVFYRTRRRALIFCNTLYLCAEEPCPAWCQITPRGFNPIETFFFGVRVSTEIARQLLQPPINSSQQQAGPFIPAELIFFISAAVAACECCDVPCWCNDADDCEGLVIARWLMLRYTWSIVALFWCSPHGCHLPLGFIHVHLLLC